jgi:hypothetical protein
LRFHQTTVLGEAAMSSGDEDRWHIVVVVAAVYYYSLCRHVHCPSSTMITRKLIRHVTSLLLFYSAASKVVV